MCLRVKDRVVLATNSERGIGRGIALKLAEEGARVVVNGITPAMVNETVDLIKAEGNTAIGVVADVSKWADSERLVKATVETFGKLDILVHNAGVSEDALVEEMTEEQWDKVISVNLKGAWMCTRAALPYMAKGRYGRIIFLASGEGVVGPLGTANYTAAAAGLIGLTLNVSREMGRWVKGEGADMTCNMIILAVNDTRLAEGIPPNVAALNLTRDLLGRPPDPRREIGGTVAFLASEKAKWVTGAKFAVSGGAYMTLLT